MRDRMRSNCSARSLWSVHLRVVARVWEDKLLRDEIRSFSRMKTLSMLAQSDLVYAAELYVAISTALRRLENRGIPYEVDKQFDRLLLEFHVAHDAAFPDFLLNGPLWV